VVVRVLGIVRRDWLPPLLLSFFLFIWMWAAWDPVDRHDWLLENLLIFLSVPLLVATFHRIRFSDGSYVLLFVFLSLHVIGSKWTYSNVPWPDWQAMGFPRNEYDRVVHFCYGLLLALPARELIARWTGRPGLSSSYFAVEFVLATSALYEIIEWITAIIVAPELGAAFLGSQGDPFDAVADMALAGLGALIAMTIHAVLTRNSRKAAAMAT